MEEELTRPPGPERRWQQRQRGRAGNAAHQLRELSAAVAAGPSQDGRQAVRRGGRGQGPLFLFLDVLHPEGVKKKKLKLFVEQSPHTESTFQNAEALRVGPSVSFALQFS